MVYLVLHLSFGLMSFAPNDWPYFLFVFVAIHGVLINNYPVVIGLQYLKSPIVGLDKFHCRKLTNVNYFSLKLHMIGHGCISKFQVGSSFGELRNIEGV